jgi:hypothetical protein
MSTPTPRTDAAQFWDRSDYHDPSAFDWFVRAEHARTLERELATCKESLHLADGTANLALLHRDAAEAKVRVLREALDEAQSCGGLTGSIFLQARAALAATEDAK